MKFIQIVDVAVSLNHEWIRLIEGFKARLVQPKQENDLEGCEQICWDFWQP